jgi:hypothetical protein
VYRDDRYISDTSTLVDGFRGGPGQRLDQPSDSSQHAGALTPINDCPAFKTERCTHVTAVRERPPASIEDATIDTLTTNRTDKKTPLLRPPSRRTRMINRSAANAGQLIRDAINELLLRCQDPRAS